MKILFCDWNGTLLNDTHIWDQARRKTFMAFGVQPPSIKDYFLELESGDYLDSYRKRGINASRDELNQVYDEEYKKHMDEVKLFPNVVKTLQYLRKKLIYLVLITAQKESLTIPLLYKFGIYHLFNETSFETFNKKAAIEEIIQKNGVAPENCFFVGDSPSDMRQAKRAMINPIAFLGGHIPEKFLSDAKFYITRFSDILLIL